MSADILRVHIARSLCICRGSAGGPIPGRWTHKPREVSERIPRVGTSGGLSLNRCDRLAEDNSDRDVQDGVEAPSPAHCWSAWRKTIARTAGLEELWKKRKESWSLYGHARPDRTHRLGSSLSSPNVTPSAYSVSLLIIFDLLIFCLQSYHGRPLLFLPHHLLAQVCNSAIDNMIQTNSSTAESWCRLVRSDSSAGNRYTDT